MLHAKRFLIFLLLIWGTAGCSAIRVANDPFHIINGERNCLPDAADCAQQLIEKHDRFSMAFLEFTERGNQFDRVRSELVYNHIRSLEQSEDGVAVLVFVHGWKHNAKFDDSNVKNFRALLAGFADNEVYGARRVVGVYVGWRGLSYDVPLIKELTYWDRKAVAEEVGSGGVTEILTRLQNISVGDDTDNTEAPKNAFLILGHSFGGAIVLSALHDVLVENISSAYEETDGNGYYRCGLTSRIADGVVLLNPAIEANRILQLKELAATCKFPRRQPNLLHVISSDGDRATTKAFYVGQWLDLVLTWDQERLSRTFGDKQVELNEVDLDVQTIGNYPGFLTGRLEENLDSGPKWKYRHCAFSATSLKACGLNSKEIANHIPVNNYDPLVFLKTDANFIADHNDVFNCDVQAYLATIALEGQSKKSYALSYRVSKSQAVSGCSMDAFRFGECLSSQLEAFGCQ